MKFLIPLLTIHFLAYSFARAQEAPPESSSLQVMDECKDLLPVLQEDLRALEAKFQEQRQYQAQLQEDYLVQFNEMTQVLLAMAKTREEETQKISESRDQLKISLQSFNQTRTDETSKNLQDDYLNLTLRLYSSLVESHKSLEILKAQISHIESSRAVYVGSIAELESLDRQKLAIEARLVNLKIKCPSPRPF
jgi:hypothetical protein